MEPERIRSSFGRVTENERATKDERVTENERVTKDERVTEDERVTKDERMTDIKKPPLSERLVVFIARMDPGGVKTGTVAGNQTMS